MTNPFTTLEYEPPIEDHPAYRETDPDYRPGDAVRVLAYDGFEFVRDDDGNQVGQKQYLSDDALEKYRRGETDLLHGLKVVLKENGHFVRVSTGGLTLTGTGSWIPKTRIIEVDEENTRRLHSRLRAEKQRQQTIERRKENTDLDVLMDEIIKPHARRKVNEVWPGGTVDVDRISWFWNTRLRKCAGKAYHGNAVPKMAGEDSDLAIGLAPGYYYRHGIDELLAVVRHELVHCWQYEHPDARGGHGPKFKQWLDDMETHRHCKNWSRG